MSEENNKKKIILGPDGKEYSTIKEMCDDYGVPVTTYNGRIKRGLSVAEALKKTNKKRRPRKNQKGMQVKDHKGRTYKSIKKMCEAYDVSPQLYAKRIKRGWSVQDSLEGRKKVYDHKGIKYSSVDEMCETYGISKNTFLRRQKNGYSIEKCLCTPAKKRQRTGNECVDHKGNTYKSQRKMCEAYGIGVAVFEYRKNKGYGLQECLEGTHIDHKGNHFQTRLEMCKFYNISPEVYRHRRNKAKWSVEDALTKPTKTKSVTDHKGIEYKSVAEMCQAYNISPRTFNDRRKHLNWTLEDALTKPVAKFITDHKGNQYESIGQMCKAYGISESTFARRKKEGMNLEQCLEKKRK